MNVLSLFDGISCGQIALNRAGIKYDNYYASEIDKYAISVVQHNYPNTIQLGDVKKWGEWDIDFSKIDLILAGFPCQSWSMAGKMGGATDPRGQLMFDMMDIYNHIKQLNPNVRFLFENVRMKKEFQDYVNTVIGVEPIEISSSKFVPQARQRLYWTNIPNVEQPTQVEYDVNSFIDGNGFPSSCGLDRVFKRKKVFNTLTATYYKGIRGSGRPAVSLSEGYLDDNREFHRMLTPEECEKLQSVPVGYTSCASKTQRYKMIGNGWTVDVIAHIFGGLK
jgi:DNA (cytosine-5)-methyltransferase 1